MTTEWPPLPYYVGPPVSDDRRFVDRDATIERLRGVAFERTHPGFVLRGPRRTGKSSVLKRFARLVESEMRVVELDLLNILGFDRSWLPHTVAETVLRSLCDELGVSYDFRDAGARSASVSQTFRRSALPKLVEAARPQQLVILFDEMEVAEACDPHAPLELIGALQPLGPSSKRPLIGVVWGRSFGTGIARAIPNPLKDFLKDDVGRFAGGDIRTAIERPLGDVFIWPNEALVLVEKLTDGHPLFVAALGGAVHAGRKTSERGPVSLAEVEAAVPQALNLAESWDDAWRQLDTTQAIFLRALAEEERPTTAFVLDRLRQWGTSYEAVHLEPFIRGMREDELIDVHEGGYFLRGAMIRRWVQRISPQEILNRSADESRSTLLPEATRKEEEGRRQFADGNYEAAALSFRAALELDSQRESVVIWLSETLLKLDLARGPETAIVDLTPAVEAAKILRGFLPTDAIRGIRAKVITRCLETALASHQEPSLLLAELRDVDPGYRSVPQAAALAATVEIETWWRELEGTDAPGAQDLADRYVLSNSQAIRLALRRVRETLESSLEDSVRAREVLLPGVAPYLLRQSELVAFPRLRDRAESDHAPSTADGDTALQAEWQICYSTVIALLTLQESPRDGTGESGHPFEALRLLLECKAANSELGAPLRAYILATFTKEFLVDLACRDPHAALSAASRLQEVDARLAMEIISNAAVAAGEAAEAGNVEVVASVVVSLPKLGLFLDGLVRESDRENAEAYLGDLVYGATYLIHRLLDDSACATILIEDSTAAHWSKFLDTLSPFEPTAVSQIRSMFRSWQEQRQDGDNSGEAKTAIRSDRISEATLRAILGHNFKVLRRVPYRIIGAAPGYVSAWAVEQSGMDLLARMYRVEGGESAVQNFLRQLWENERRLLSNLATRWEGRSLPKVRIARYEAERGVLILVTDMLGPQSLRDLIDSGEVAKSRKASRAKLWGHLRGLLDALGALHRAGYIHRAIRPENIMVDADALTLPGRQWLRLSNFEWCVYLYGISDSQAQQQRLHDRYIAPESLAVHRGGRSGSPHLGEGTSSDIFCLGLVLFECLVGPLNADELRRLSVEYESTDHFVWIEKTLMTRIDAGLEAGDLWTDEVTLLKGMLQPVLTRRTSDIEAILERVMKLAQQETQEHMLGSGEPLPLVSTLDPRNRESIERFIVRNRPDLENYFTDSDIVARWIELELERAQVYANRRAGAPLLLVGDTTNFTIEPFSFHGQLHQHVCWLKIASAQDAPAGRALGNIPGVRLHNYRRDMPLAPMLTMPNGWTPWLSAAQNFHESLTNNERALVERLRWSVELERNSWQHQILAYKLVEYQPSKRLGEVDVAVISDRGKDAGQRDDDDSTPTYNLSNLMAQAADRQNTYFELGMSRDPTEGFYFGRRWIQVSSDEDKRTVRLIRYRDDLSEDPPHEGWIRPYSLAGHRAIYQRRRAVLQEVEHDPYLVRSLLTPQDTYDDLNIPRSRSFNQRLDLDKAALCDAIQNRRPLFVLQGPPGTGKTTLAAEVILRTLHDRPSSRILVVAQAHDPLNNLLERVEEELDKPSRKGRRPMSVRLSSEERLDERRYGVESTRVPRRFHPSQVANRVMENARKWRQGQDTVGEKSAALWKAVCETQALHGISRSLEVRLVSSANLVYATANDRRLAALKSGTFDLVIFEEAAKALPAEVLSPLRFARRWLLIGDQAQLPPFDIQNMESELKKALDKLKKERDGSVQSVADTHVIDTNHILGDVPPPPDRWAAINAEMIRVLRFFRYLHDNSGRVYVPMASHSASVPGDVLRGLSGMLTTQWRMHPVIGDFVSKCFYDGKVKNGNPVELAKWRKHSYVAPEEIKGRSIVWLDVPWADDQKLASERRGFGGGYENPYETRVLLGFLQELFQGLNSKPDVAILSPYRAQVRALEQILADFRFGGAGPKHLGEFKLLENVYTVDGFQGKQADVVAISMVRNRPPIGGRIEDEIRRSLGFLEATERSTVVFSRAERLMVIVGSLKYFRRFAGTKMREVAEEIDHLSKSRHSGVVVLPGEKFIKDRHWERLVEGWENYHRRIRRLAHLPDRSGDIVQEQ